MHGTFELACGQDGLIDATFESRVAQGRINLYRELSKMVELDEAEVWASEHRAKLLELLDDPSHDHGVGALLPSHQVLVAHIVGVVEK